jgi:release factor glutamine methyltransferase
MLELELASTRRSLIHEATEQLSRAGFPEPRREALRIWNGLTPCEGYPSAERYRIAITRRSSGEPLAYVTGWTGFRHLTLRSDARALIPRPETEGLVELLLERVRMGRVADIGTGSGCIALSLALEGEYSDVIAIDYSAEALALAADNMRAAGLAVTLMQGNLCDALGSETCDALISNPPYLTAAEHASLDPAVRNWEPAMALVSGDDGLEATARLLRHGRRVLRADGWLAVEVDCTRARLAAELAAELGWTDVAICMDLFGRERYLLARRSNTR